MPIRVHGPWQHLKRLRVAAMLLLVAVLLPAPLLGNQRGRFEGKLRLEDVAAEYVNTGPHDPGHTEFRLLEDYTYIGADGRRWTVPKGTVVNGASIPKAVWSLIGGPWSGEYRNASVIHDYMCEALIESSDFTHRLFYEAMTSSNVGEKLAKMMYFAVKKAGPKWEKKPGFFPPVVTRGEVSRGELQAIADKIDRENPSLEELDRLAGQ
jgi:hypothetical protein